jgi:hypothetical protein
MNRDSVRMCTEFAATSFTRKVSGEQRKTGVGIVGIGTEVSTRDLPNTKQVDRRWAATFVTGGNFVRRGYWTEENLQQTELYAYELNACEFCRAAWSVCGCFPRGSVI